MIKNEPSPVLVKSLVLCLALMYQLNTKLRSFLIRSFKHTSSPTVHFQFSLSSKFVSYSHPTHSGYVRLQVPRTYSSAVMVGRTNGFVDQEDKKAREVAKLVLCFDGTGNAYSGTESDTNIVKLYQKFDREAPNQFHYYQRESALKKFLFIEAFTDSPSNLAGIGTYVAGEASLNAGIWGRFTRWISQTVDEGIGTSFDQHVIAGYRFIMRYYTDSCDISDKIYIFGFSRGAFTARFLARMISEIGLLSKGNEEMVPFAYKAYQDSQLKSDPASEKKNDAFMKSFKTTFCRSVKVHFLGLFDTVNSVGVFEVPFTKNMPLPTVRETADHVRHAVSIDERRAKFKAALLAQDRKDVDGEAVTKDGKEDVKEVYFAGNHGDIGGGWGSTGKRTKTHVPLNKIGLSEETYGAKELNPQDALEANDPVQLSDIALEWMIKELDSLHEPTTEENKADRIVWNYHKDIFLNNYYSKVEEAVTAPQHDMLKRGCGSSWYMFIMWKLLGKVMFPVLEALVRY